MPKRILIDEFDVTFTRDELLNLMRMVRRDIRNLPDGLTAGQKGRVSPDTRGWDLREKLLRNTEEKISMSYNLSGTRLATPEDFPNANEASVTAKAMVLDYEL